MQYTKVKCRLVNFEKQVAKLWEAGNIRHPIHLSKGNEKQLINIFKKIKPRDWVFGTHRSHYQALLKGIKPNGLRNKIIHGGSMHLYSAEHKFFTSAIVGGILPIALGVALGIKLRGMDDHVWCFVGDMCAETGVFHEVVKYATYNKLPITFIVEDNKVSVKTPTQKVWRYLYENIYPHMGTGKYIEF